MSLLSLLSLRALASGAALALAAPLLGLVTAAPAQADAASDLSGRFQSYGNNGSGGWTGGDGTQSLKLPDGRVLWFFDDSYIGKVEGGQRRPFGATMARNSMIIENGASMTTVTGPGNSSQVAPSAGADWVWGAGEILNPAKTSVLKFYQRFVRTGPGMWDWRPVGVEARRMPISSIGSPSTYETISLPAAATDCRAHTTGCLLWGTDLLTVGNWTYIYGTEVVGDAGKYLHIARVPAGDFSPAGWRYWTGSSWSTSAAASTRRMNGVSEGFSVIQNGSRYAIVTQALEGKLDGDVTSYYSSTPWGFNGSQRSRLYAPPTTTTDWGHWAYEFQVVDHLSSGNQIVVSYNTNSQYTDGACTPEGYWNPGTYRPRFVTLTLPTTANGLTANIPASKTPLGPPWMLENNRPAYCSSGTVPTPRNVTATDLGNGSVRLNWAHPANAGQWNYSVSWRDLDGSDTSWHDGAFFAPSPTSWRLDWMPRGHRIEYRIAANTWSGRNSAYIARTVVPGFATPTNVVATRSGAYCNVTWSDAQTGVYWEVREYDSSTGVSRVMGPFSTKSASVWVTKSTRYDYSVRAVTSDRKGSWSAADGC